MIEFEWSGARFVLADCGGGVLGEEIPMHCHSDGSYELHFITGGEGTLITRAGEYKMRTGNFLLQVRVWTMRRSLTQMIP